MPTTFDDLPDDAHLRVVPCHPALSEAAGEELVAAVAKLFAQFRREGAVTAAAVEVQRSGAFLVIAWCEPPGAPLSGCRKDKLAKVLARHGERSGSELLAPPPIVIEREGRPCCLTQGALRSLLAVGAVDAATPAWDHLASRLAAWDAGRPRPLGEIPWLAAALERMARR